MRRSYLKLQKNFKTDSLKPEHINVTRDCDAFIAFLLGWTDIELDTGKEWVGDAPQGYTKFNCLGRCVIPRFTSEQGLQLLEYLTDTKIITQKQNLDIKKIKSIYHITLTQDDVELHRVEAPTFSLGISRLLSMIKIKSQENNDD